MASSYYPPRAGWRGGMLRLTPGWRHRFRVLRSRLPTLTKLLPAALGLLLPGGSFYRVGWRKLGLGIFAAYAVAAAVFLLSLGALAANWAFLFMLSAHSASVSQALRPWLAERSLATQIAVGLLVFLAVSLLVYVPARAWFEQHIAGPLPASHGLVLPQNRWLVWPAAGVRMHGVGEDVTARGLLKIAVVREEQLVGRPFKRWLFKQQVSP